MITREQSTVGDSFRGMLAIKDLLKELHNNDNPKLQVGAHFTTVRYVSNWNFSFGSLIFYCMQIFPLCSNLVLEQLSNLNVIVNTLAAFSKGESSVQRLQELLPVAGTLDSSLLLLPVPHH